MIVNQVFVDETRYPNGMIHKEMSSFVFNDGILDTTASIITKSNQTIFEALDSLLAKAEGW